MNKADFERRQKIYTELGKFILDISKLVFGGVILTSIVNSSFNKLQIFCIGLLVVIAGTFVGFGFINLGLKKKRK